MWSSACSSPSAFSLLSSRQLLQVTTIFSKSFARRISQSNVHLPTIKQYPISGSSESAQSVLHLLHQRRSFLAIAGKYGPPSLKIVPWSRTTEPGPECFRDRPTRPNHPLSVLSLLTMHA